MGGCNGLKIEKDKVQSIIQMQMQAVKGDQQNQGVPKVWNCPADGWLMQMVLSARIKEGNVQGGGKKRPRRVDKWKGMKLELIQLGQTATILSGFCFEQRWTSSIP